MALSVLPLLGAAAINAPSCGSTSQLSALVLLTLAVADVLRLARLMEWWLGCCNARIGRTSLGCRYDRPVEAQKAQVGCPSKLGRYVSKILERVPEDARRGSVHELRVSAISLSTFIEQHQHYNTIAMHSPVGIEPSPSALSNRISTAYEYLSKPATAAYSAAIPRSSPT